MALNHQHTAQTLLAARTRIFEAAWLIVRKAQTAEDLFQDVSVKAGAKLPANSYSFSLRGDQYKHTTYCGVWDAITEMEKSW